MAGRPVPGALNIGDGGGKGESRLLGCGLEKRPPYPRTIELVGEAPIFGRRVSLWWGRSKWPKDGNEKGTQDKDKEIEGQAKFEVDTEAVPPWPFNVKDQDRCTDPV